MIVKHKLNAMDLAVRGIKQWITVKQGDANSRALEIPLLAAGQPWTIPEGATAIVRYRKRDGTAGLYDTLPDGTTPAVTYTGNVLTVNLAPQILTCSGLVSCDVVLTNTKEVLATFNFYLDVEPSPAAGTDTSSQNYYKVLSLDDLNALLNEFEERIESIQGGQPVTVSSAAEMTDIGTIYLYLGNDDGYAYGYIYVYQDGAWVNTGLYGRGQNGETPEISVTETDAGVTITVNGASYTVKNGADGKTAYAYAVEGGYTGTEVEFRAMLAQDFPASVTAEAKRVAQNVQSVRTGKSLTFVACSDAHLNLSKAEEGGNTLYAATLRSLKMAGQGIQALRKRIPVDAAVLLGDFTWADSSYTAAKCKDDFTECIRIFSGAVSGIPSAWLVGNHDMNYGASRDRTLTEDEIYAYIGANSTGDTCDPDYPEKNYYYKDFDGQKIRMIFLNTVDALTEYTPADGTAAKSEWMSAIQLQWLADTALDFSDKADASQWAVVICSHHPVNYGDAMKRACMLLEAYRDGTSGNLSYTDGNGTAQNITYDFTAGDKAEIICNIHGHSHNFGYKKISSSDSVTPWLWRVCIPCINCGRENEQATNADLAEKYGEFDADGNPVYYRKAEWSDAISGWVYNAEKGTSFCVVTIDRKNKKIYAHCFGTGYDRAIAYSEDESGSGDEPETPAYTNLVPTSEALDSADVYNGGLGYRDGYYISSSSGGDSAKAGHATTGMIYYEVKSAAQPAAVYIKGGVPSRIAYYGTDKAFKSLLYTDNGNFTQEQLDTNYYKLTPGMLDSGNSSIYENKGAGGYLRFDCEIATGADLIITLNEPIG